LTNIYKNIEAWLGVGIAVQEKVLYSLLIIVFIWLLRKALNFLVNRLKYDVKTKYRVRRIATYVSVFIALLLIFRVWFDGINSMATYFGLLSAGIAIALKDPIVDIAGWVFITFWRPIDVGDRIQIGTAKGDIIHIGLFFFSVNEIGNWVDSDQRRFMPKGLIIYGTKFLY